jgi:hypothetical protein
MSHRETECKTTHYIITFDTTQKGKGSYLSENSAAARHKPSMDSRILARSKRKHEFSELIDGQEKDRQAAEGTREPRSLLSGSVYDPSNRSGPVRSLSGGDNLFLRWSIFIGMMLAAYLYLAWFRFARPGTAVR